LHVYSFNESLITKYSILL